MATRKGQTPTTAKRRSASRATTKGAVKSTDTRVMETERVTEQSAQVATQDIADRSQEAFITCRHKSFQVRAERERIHPNGFVEAVAEKYLKFGPTRRVLADEETLAEVEAILEGRHTDGRVTGKHFAKIAREAGLGIIYPGLVARPMATWDSIGDASQVVAAALASGVLGSVGAVERAIAYEQQGPKRRPRAVTRDAVVAQLETLLEAFKKGTAPTPEEAAAQIVAPTPVPQNPAADTSSEGHGSDSQAAQAAGEGPGLIPTSEEL